VIISFGDKDTELLFNRVRVRKLPLEISLCARNKLLIINAAASENDLQIPPGNHFEKLKGDKKAWRSIRINAQWRIVFRWINGNAHDVTVTDYH